MAYGSNRDKNLRKANAKNIGKADMIMEADKEISRKIDLLAESLKKSNERLESFISESGRKKDDENLLSRQITEVYKTLHEEYSSLRRELRYIALQNENVYNETSRKLNEISAGVPAQAGVVQTASSAATPVSSGVPAAPVVAEIDYDLLAEKIAALLPVQEVISPDYIACKVAEQITLPEATSHESVSDDAVSTLSATEESGEARPAYVAPVEVQFDEDELADRIALKVGSLKAEDFDILVDDDGCASISKEITDRLNYDAISAVLAEKLRTALETSQDEDIDYDEMAGKISEKITVAGINEESIADKAAAALSNYMPEIDTDEIADKVARQVLSSMPAVEVDSDTISKNVADKLIAKQEDSDYDIVIDEDGLSKITEYVSTEVKKSADERFDVVDRELAELKAMLASGAILREAATSAEALDDSYIAEETEIVTVSDVVEDSGMVEEEEVPAVEAAEEETAEAEPMSEAQAEETEEAEEAGETEETEENGGFDQLVEDIDEKPADGEIMPDGLESGEGGGVDFEHMMKYNRSFIARIIQSPDEYKQYYGQVKTALLSYSKVNSNVAWSAERFNKGRETIARFKIRGKTLCLYLALDPNEFEQSVYHQVDVSDNKSMHGTPMMVKIKSPRGAKKAIRLIDEMLARRDGIKRNKVIERDYAAMYPYETIEELIEDGLVKDVSKN